MKPSHALALFPVGLVAVAWRGRKPSAFRVAIEAVVVAGGLLALSTLLGKGGQEVAIAGALFHVLCEVSGLNKWYVLNYGR